MTLTTIEKRIVDVLSTTQWSLSYKELVDEIDEIDGKHLYKAIESLSESGWIMAGPSTYESGVSVRTWTMSPLGLDKLLNQETKPKKSKKETPVAETPQTHETNPILDMFDEAARVMRASIEASLLRPLYKGDVSEAIETLEKYAKVAATLGDDKGHANLEGITQHLRDLEGTNVESEGSQSESAG